MRTPAKLAAFGGGVSLAFAAALGIGAATGSPFDSDVAAQHGHSESDGSADPAHAGKDMPGGRTVEVAGVDTSSGLAVSENGYTLQLSEPVLPAGDTVELVLRIVADDGRPVADFAVSHDKRMHVILVRGDTIGFQHVHPKMAADGTWSTPVTLRPGGWRVLADFVPATGVGAGEPVILGADLFVGGRYDPVALPEESRVTTVDGYGVALGGDLSAGRNTTLSFTVTRAGRSVTDLQPYLGAYGHLVALRAGDLAYLHVHPEGESPDGDTGGPQIAFSAAAPTPGTYRLFLDFQHGGEVRTAEFTLVLDAADGSPDTASPGTGEGTSAGDGARGGSGKPNHGHGDGEHGG